MKSIQYLAPIAALMIFQGCAFSDSTLKVAHDPSVHTVGPISDVKAVQFKAPAVTDTRLDKARIGWKKNGYGQNTANIYTEKPVEKIVENAIVEAIVDNHHSIGPEGRVQIVGTVDRFWFETDVNFWTIKFIGDVQCTLDFVDTQTSKSIYKRNYAGTYSHETGGGYEKTWAMVMTKALDKMIEDVVLDDELAQAMKAYK